MKTIGDATMQDDQNINRIIRFPQLREITSLSRSTIWRMEANGDFPRRIRVGARGVGWRLSDINSWLTSRPELN